MVARSYQRTLRRRLPERVKSRSRGLALTPGEHKRSSGQRQEQHHQKAPFGDGRDGRATFRRTWIRRSALRTILASIRTWVSGKRVWWALIASERAGLVLEFSGRTRCTRRGPGGTCKATWCTRRTRRESGSAKLAHRARFNGTCPSRWSDHKRANKRQQASVAMETHLQHLTNRNGSSSTSDDAIVLSSGGGFKDYPQLDPTGPPSDRAPRA